MIRTILLSCFLFISCCCHSQTSNAFTSPEENNVTILDFPTSDKAEVTVDSVINLQGNCYRLKEGTTLRFLSGKIANGTLIGNRTKIVGYKHIFEDVAIKGSWNVENISTEMFCNLSDTNALKNVFALACSEIKNSITIQSGSYIVEATTQEQNVLQIPSNTKVTIDGEIKMLPNNFKSYSILCVANAVNVSISGNGSLIGEREEHTGTKGEWGMGIRINNADAITVNGLSIHDAWGDGIYIGKDSKKVTVRNCKIDNCRRQGISIIEGTEVEIQNCLVTNIHGTAPQYAIDIEPNTNNSATNILIKQVVAKDCVGGFAILANAEKKRIASNVCIKDCIISGTNRTAFVVKGGCDVVITNNAAKDINSKYVFNVVKSKNVTIKNNTISTDKYVFNNINAAIIKSNRILKGIISPSHKEN